MPIVSVIVPVYNVAPYIRKCLDSLLIQTLKDIEIIFVDDGSTDGSGDICDEYVERDPRIRVIHEPNKGLSSARNTGIDISIAQYVIFVDADDWVEPQFCELPCNTAVEFNADLVLFLYRRLWKNGKTHDVKSQFHNGIVSEQEALRFNTCVSASSWLGLYRKSLFNGIRFPNNMYFEDIATSHKLIHVARKICLINEILYNYRVDRPGSITNTPAIKYNSDRREMLILRANDLYTWGYKDLAQKCAISLLVKYGWKDPEMKPFVDMVKEIGKTPECFPWRHKAMLQLFKVSPALFDAVCLAAGERIK